MIQNKSSAVNKYKQTSSTGASYATPHRLIQMLMQGALDRIATARGGIERNEIELKNNAIGLAISIIGGLRDSLNFEEGGEIAANLDSLYEYMNRRLTEANMKNDVELLDEVTSLMNEIKSAWDVMPQYIQDAASVEEIKEKMESEQEAR